MTNNTEEMWIKSHVHYNMLFCKIYNKYVFLIYKNLKNYENYENKRPIILKKCR